MNQILDRSLVSRNREVSEMYDQQEQEPVLMQGFPAEPDQRVTWANWMSPHAAWMLPGRRASAPPPAVR